MHQKWSQHVVFFTLLIVIVSSTVIIFGHLLQLVIFIQQMLPSFFVFFSVITGIFTYFIYKKHHSSITQELTKIYTKNAQEPSIPIIHIPLLIGTTLLSHLFGASVGREGVAVQIGATFGSFFSHRRRIFKIAMPSALIITTSMATGFAALFGLPLTAALFSIEVSQLYKKVSYTYLIIPFIGSLVAAQFSHRFGLTHLHFQIEIPSFSISVLYALILLIFLLFSTTTLYLITHHTLQPCLKKMLKNPILRIGLCSFFLSFLLFYFQLDVLKGLGTVLISQSFLDQSKISPLFPFLKLFFTLGFLSLGFKGGEVTPLFSIGAMLGAITATLFGLPSAFFAIIGLAAFFSATTKTYIAPLFLAIEITTPLILPFLIPIIIFLFFTTPRAGVYQLNGVTHFKKYRLK